MYSAQKKELDQKVEAKLPEPKGYKLLIALPEIEEKTEKGAYCKEGDFVIFRSYSGTRFKVMGKEFRLINDDTVEAVIDDPRGYTRV